MKNDKPFDLAYHPTLKARYVDALGQMSPEHLTLLELHHSIPMTVDELARTLKRPRRNIVILLEEARDAMARVLGTTCDENLLRRLCRDRVLERSQAHQRAQLKQQVAAYLAELTLSLQQGRSDKPFTVPTTMDVTPRTLAERLVGVTYGVGLLRTRRALHSLEADGLLRRPKGRMTILHWTRLAEVGSRKLPQVAGVTVRWGELVFPPSLELVDLSQQTPATRGNSACAT